MSASQMIVSAESPRPLAMLARMAVALSVSAFGTKRGCQRTQAAAEDGDRQRGGRQRRNGKEPARERGRPVAHRLAEKVENERCGGDSDASEHVGERPLLQPPLVHGRAVLFGSFGLVGGQGVRPDHQFRQFQDILRRHLGVVIVEKDILREDIDRAWQIGDKSSNRWRISAT